jgi:hypothetical protein
MKIDTKELESRIDELQEKCSKSTTLDDKEGTILLVKTSFNTRSIYLNVEKVEIFNGSLDEITNARKEDEEYFVINCFEAIDSYDFTNGFIFPQMEVKTGDKVWVVTADDMDPYGVFIVGVFTEEVDKEKIVRMYNRYINDLNDEDDEPYVYYPVNVFELVIS